MAITQIPAGGTGAPTAAGARIKLGVELGVDVQAFDNILESLSELSDLGFVVQTAPDVVSARTITGTANEVTIINGNGVSGNPVISLPTALTFTGKTVTGGTFNVSDMTLSTPLPVGSGGTGVTTIGALKTTLGYGTAADANIGTSGGTVPLLNGSNTWSNTNSFSTLNSSSVNTGPITSSSVNSSGGYFVSGSQVVGSRKTGWTADSGTADRAGGATFTAIAVSNPPTQAEVQAISNAVQRLSRQVKALKDDLISHGLIG